MNDSVIKVGNVVRRKHGEYTGVPTGTVARVIQVLGEVTVRVVILDGPCAGERHTWARVYTEAMPPTVADPVQEAHTAMQEAARNYALAAAAETAVHDKYQELRAAADKARDALLRAQDAHGRAVMQQAQQQVAK